MLDEEPRVAGRRRGRGAQATVCSDALYHLKALPSGGRKSGEDGGGFHFKMEDRIYDVIDESEYEALVAKLREEAKYFIVDDDGLGYGDKGQEEDWSIASVSLSSDEDWSRRASCHCVALDVDGRCYTWGRNEKGQLGHRDKIPRDRPTVVFGISKAGAGRSHIVVVTEDGNSFAFGWNKHGQLGTGFAKNEVEASLVRCLVFDVRTTACGANFTMWLTSVE